MKWIKQVVSVLLILVTLGSVMSSALAVSTEQKVLICLNCSKATGKSKVTVTEPWQRVAICGAYMTVAKEANVLKLFLSYFFIL
jgi:hypothetical protein